jgi:hypothetical protein
MPRMVILCLLVPRVLDHNQQLGLDKEFLNGQENCADARLWTEEDFIDLLRGRAVQLSQP